MSATSTATSSTVSSSVITAGMDIGTSSVKTAIISSNGTGGDDVVKVLALQIDRIRRRDLRQVIDANFSSALEKADVVRDDIVYVASTGEGELVEFRRGHFYGMTTHARGAAFLMPGVRAVIDIGALHARAMRISEESRVLGYRMTNQCASGSGQFLENVARYLGIPLEEVGTLSCSAKDPEMVSSICAVLAETDVINMVSRGIQTSDILRGIHLSMAGRFVKLLRAVKTDGDVAITGGLAKDTGIVSAIEDIVAEEKMNVRVRTHDDSIHAGALGAALWAAFRHRKLQMRKEVTA